MHLISTKEVISQWVPTLKKEEPFVTFILPSCQFCGRYAIISCYISKKTTQRVIKQSNQQFMLLICTKVVLSLWVPTFMRENPLLTVIIPTCQFSGRCTLFSVDISNQTSSKS